MDPNTDNGTTDHTNMQDITNCSFTIQDNNNNMNEQPIINEEPITINILIGKGGIIDEDIKHQLREAIGFYKLFFTRINLSSEREIIESLHYYQRK